MKSPEKTRDVENELMIPGSENNTDENYKKDKAIPYRHQKTDGNGKLQVSRKAEKKLVIPWDDSDTDENRCVRRAERKGEGGSRRPVRLRAPGAFPGGSQGSPGKRPRGAEPATSPNTVKACSRSQAVIQYHITKVAKFNNLGVPFKRVQ